ncbi:MAG: substrate-binding domain-containing protein [Clostridia bacterium]|nr:substrate-binding domain-containing protein [Clostridia bacterium]
MLVMVMVFVACTPAAAPAEDVADDAMDDAEDVVDEVVDEAVDEVVDEGPATWTSEAGIVYNKVAKEDIVIGFNNGSITVDFLRMVGENTVEVAEREGIKIVMTESNFDAEQILPNTDNLLAQGANIIIDFNVNAEIGGNLVDYCAEKGVPVIGVDVVYPSPTTDEVSWFFGANNQMAGETAGMGLAEGVKERWGGEIDQLVLLFNSENGPAVKLRCSEMQTGLIAGGIDVPDDKVTWIELGGGGSDTTVAANEKFTDWLAAHPDMTKICVGTVNTETGQGVFSAAVTSGRTEDVMLATNNNGNQTLAAWETEDAIAWLGGVVYNPGSYGEYLIPLCISILAGENPDKMTTMDHDFLTMEDIDAVKAEMGVE